MQWISAQNDDSPDRQEISGAHAGAGYRVEWGLRRGEQYGLEWPNVNVENCVLTIPRSKCGEAWHIALNSMALEKFKRLFPNMEKNNRVFVSKKRRVRRWRPIAAGSNARSQRPESGISRGIACGTPLPVGG